MEVPWGPAGLFVFKRFASVSHAVPGWRGHGGKTHPDGPDGPAAAFEIVSEVRKGRRKGARCLRPAAPCGPDGPVAPVAPAGREWLSVKAFALLIGNTYLLGLGHVRGYVSMGGLRGGYILILSTGWATDDRLECSLVFRNTTTYDGPDGPVGRRSLVRSDELDIPIEILICNTLDS